MLLQRLVLQDFRNVAAADLAFGAPRIFLLGANGQGKTNVLEAAGLLTALRSFRTADGGLLVREGCAEGALAWEVEHERLGAVRVSFRLGAGGRELRWGTERISRLADHIGVFPTVVFSSQDLLLVRAGPGERRRWLDLVLSAMEPAYFRALQDYTRALAGRNALLRQAGSSQEGPIGAFERILAESGARLIRLRAGGLAELSAEFAAAYGRLAPAAEGAALTYEPAVAPATEDEPGTQPEDRSGGIGSQGEGGGPMGGGPEAGGGGGGGNGADGPEEGVHRQGAEAPGGSGESAGSPAAAACAEENALALRLRERLAHTRERDRRVGSTLGGPHRDDLGIRVDGRSARDYGSEGQQRCAVLALRLAQAHWYQGRSGIRPVLLADDVLGELDPVRRERLWSALDPRWQVIATGTELPESASPWLVYGVRAGTFEARKP